MTNNITTYYIPSNPKIEKGTIYNLYLNKNTNLDLTSITDTKNISLNNIIKTNNQTITQTNNITISKEDYTKLLELNNKAYQLTTERTNNIQKFIQEETKTTTALAQLNTERQELIKKLTKKGPML